MKVAMEHKTIPEPVIHRRGEILGLHYYHHRRLETLFVEYGAPGEPSLGKLCYQVHRMVEAL